MSNLYYGLISVLLVATVAGIMSCFVLWRSTEYFADAMSHALMVGAALALAVNVNQMVIMVLMSLILAVIVVFFISKTHNENLVISILSNGLMALSIIIVFFFKGSGYEDFDEFLLGEVSKLGVTEFIIVLCLSLISFFMFFYRKEEWLLISVNKEISLVDISNKKRLDIEYYILMSVFIAITIKIVGILLITSILTIPAAIARFYSKDVVSMICISVVVSTLSSVVGIVVEHAFDIPFAAIVVGIEFVVFVFSAIINRRYI